MRVWGVFLALGLFVATWARAESCLSSTVNLCATDKDRYAPQADGVVETSPKRKSKAAPPGLLTTLLEPQLQEIKQQVIFACCRDDLSCSKTFQRLKVEWCDDCTQGSFYTLNQDQRADIFLLAQDRLYQQSKQFSSAGTRRIEALLQRYSRNYGFSLDQIWKYNTKSERRPHPGRLVMSQRMLRRNIDQIEFLNTYRHELAHACDFIRAQQLITNPKTNETDIALGLSRLIHGARQEVYCSIDVYLKKFYSRLLLDLNVKEGFLECVEQAIDKTMLPQHQLYCKSSCPGAMLVESYAKAFELVLLAKGPRSEREFASCQGAQDGYHLGSQEVSQCLKKFSY